MAPGGHEIETFNLTRRGQHVVRIASCFRGDQVMHDCKKIVSQQTFNDALLIGDCHDRIAVVDAQTADRRIQIAIAEVVAEIPHVQRSHTWLVLVRHQDSAIVQRRILQRPRRTCQAATAMSPRTGQHRKARQRAERHRPVAMMFEPDQRSQQRWRGGCVFVCKAFDFICRQADDRRDAGRSVIMNSLHELFVAQSVSRDIIMIDQIVANDHMHHRQSQCGVAAWSHCEMPVRLFGRASLHRIDDHNLRAASPSFQNHGPQM